MKLTLVCPHCSAELELDDITPGAHFECPGCGGECIAPGADPPAPASRPRQLRIPARRDTAPPPVVVQAPQRGIFATAFRGCGILLVMAALLVVAIVGCNFLGLFGAATVAKKAAEALPDVSAPGSARSSTSNPATMAGLDGMTDEELRALARAVRERLRDRKG